MKRFFESFSSGQDKFTLTQSNMFKVMFQTDFGNVYGSTSSISEELDLVIQSIDLPNIIIGTGQNDLEIDQDYVSFSAPSNSILKPEQRAFTITILNTLENVAENIFLPWMEHVTSTKNTNNYPFFRAKVNVIIFKNDIKYNFGEGDVKMVYEFDGVYPVHIKTPTLSHDIAQAETTRTVGFKFNTMRLKYNNVQSFTGR